MNHIRFDATREDADLIREIVDRAARRWPHIFDDRLNLTMDLSACHLNGCPLDLGRLLEADNFNFLHDVGGIQKHMDRTTGKLLDHFLPRTSL